MCLYCVIGDHFFRHDPPWEAWPHIPYVPAPIVPPPIHPWSLERLKELEDMLARIKALEDKLGCPCEPAKADYLTILRERIEKLEKRAEEIT